MEKNCVKKESQHIEKIPELGFWDKHAFEEEKELDGAVLYFLRIHLFDFPEIQIQVVGNVLDDLHIDESNQK